MPIRWRKILPYDTLSGLQFFQLFRFGSVFLISIILPRSGLLPGEVGLFESFIFFAGVVSYFWLTGLIQALLPLASRGTDKERGIESRGPDFRRDDKEQGIEPGGPDFRRDDNRLEQREGKGGRVAFFNSFLLLVLFSGLAALALWLFSPLLGRLLEQELPRDIVGLVILYLLLFAPSTLVEYWYVLADQSNKLVRYGIISFSLQVLLVGIPVILGLGVKSAMWGMIAAGGFRTIWLLTILYKNEEFRISLPFWKRYLALGGPVIMSVLLSGSAQYVNGFIVTARFDTATFAIFRYGAKELPLTAMLAYALSNAMVPVITREGTEKGLKMLRERSTRMASWMFPMTILLVLLSYFIYPLIYGKNFLESAGVVNLFYLLVVSRLLFPQTVLLALEKTRIQMVAAFLELILNIGLALIFVQLWGIRGVALATVLAYFFERVILMGYTSVVLKIPVKQYVDIRRFAAWTSLLIAAYLFTELVIYPLMKG